MQDGHQFQHGIEPMPLLQLQQPRTDRADRGIREQYTPAGPLQQGPDETHLVPLQEFFIEKIPVKLYRNLLDHGITTLVREPAMLEIGSDQYELQVADNLHMIPHYSFGPRGVFDEIQFEFFMVMEREVKFPLGPREKCEAIALGQWSDFPQQFWLLRHSGS